LLTHRGQILVAISGYGSANIGPEILSWTFVEEAMAGSLAAQQRNGGKIVSTWWTQDDYAT
jgi:hypothetical protein